VHLVLRGDDGHVGQLRLAEQILPGFELPRLRDAVLPGDGLPPGGDWLGDRCHAEQVGVRQRPLAVDLRAPVARANQNCVVWWWCHLCSLS